MDTKNLEKIIQLHEGYKQKVYKCPAGYLTVGIGRNVQTKGLSIQEALYLLRNDIQECQNLLEPYVWYSTLDDIRKGVLIELCFNLGLYGLLKFKKTLVRIANEEWDEAADELCRSKWSQQVGPARRENICYRLKYGQYP